MSYNLRTLAFTIMAVLMIAGCKKDPAEPAQTDFSPLTAGSSWTYRSTTTGQAATTYTLTATNRDTSVNGRTYRVLSNSAGGTSYRNKSGNDYYSYGNFSAVNIQLEQLYLKDNVNVGTTWQSTVPFTIPQFPIPLTATLVYTLAEKGTSRAVNGVNFTNVTKVGLTVSISGGVGQVATSDFYYAAGVGLIENTTNIQAVPLAGVPASSTTDILTSYTIR